MRPRAGASWLALVILVILACCTPTSRYEVLSTFFDGVPKPVDEGQTPELGAPGQAGASARSAASSVHGPYGAKLCTACHESTARNTLVAPLGQLCQRCHEIRLDAAYIHGPLASGGCTACHDPHSSRYGYLLVSDAETFCLHCHERQALVRNDGHLEGGGPCTTCHEAHQSNRKFLLK